MKTVDSEGRTVKCHQTLSSCLKGGWRHSGSARAKVNGRWRSLDYAWSKDPGPLLKEIPWQSKLRAEKRRLGYEIYDAKRFGNGQWVARLVEMQALVASFVAKQGRAPSAASGKGLSTSAPAAVNSFRVLESFDGEHQ